MIQKLLLVLSAVFLLHRTEAQVDTSFWFVAPDFSAGMGESPVVLHLLTYDQPSVVRISQPALTTTAAVNLSVALSANSIFTLDLSSYVATGALESAPANSVSSKGIYISSKELISVYYTLGSGSGKEIISLKGQSALGTDFYVAIPKTSAVLTHSITDGGIGFDIVATQSGTTTVLITPRAQCVGRSKNITFSRILQRGETFSVLDTNKNSASELAGSIVSADQPIAVTVKGTVSNGTLVCPSYFADQITPSTQIGMDYVVIRGNGSSDHAFILAPQNATSFTVASASSTVNTLINSTETYSLTLTDPVTYIRCDKPTYVFHLSGFGCSMSGTQLAPVYCAGSYSAAFVRLSSDSLFLNVAVRAGAQNSFALVSNASTISVSGSSFAVVPGSNGNLMSGRLYFPTGAIPVGSHNLLLNRADVFDASVHNGGTLGGSGYAQVSSFKSTVFVKANAASVATICANSQFTLNGVVGGGPNTGQWSLVNGYGTFLSGATQLTNNVYQPSLLDTTNNSPSNPPQNRNIKIVLRSTGVCPNVTDTLRLHVKQPPIVSVGASSLICGNYKTIQLNGLVYGATNQGMWSILSPASGTFISGANSFTPVYQITSTDTSQTVLRFMLSSTNNGVCNAVQDTLEVYVNKPPIVISSAVKPLQRCSNNASLTLNGVVTGTASNTGIWTTSGSGLFTPNNLALNANYLPASADVAAGSVWLRLESTNNGICFPTRDSVQLMFTQASFVNAGSDINTCANSPAAPLNGVLSGSNTASVSWLGGLGTFSPSAAVLTPTYHATTAEIAAGFVTLTLTTVNNGQCLGSEDVIRVNFQPKPLANFTVNPVCLGQISFFGDKSLNLSQSGVINGWKWKLGDDTTLIKQKDPQHIYKNAGSYQVTLIVKNSFDCFDTIQKTITVNALPTASFSLSRDCVGSDQLIRFKDESFIALPDTMNENGYYWDFGGFGFSFSRDTSVVFPSEGLYTISHIVSSKTGCQSAVTRTVSIKPRPQARFIYLNNNVFGVGANVQFRDTSLYAESWSWDFGNGQTSKIKYPEVYYAVNGVYTVNLVVTDEFGCPNSYSLEVKISTVVNEINKLVPNVITPNNDGKNDFWRLDFIDVYFPKAEISLYNRWGDQIFSSVGYSNAWDGSYKGNPLPVGVYYYTIDLKDGETPVLKGSVTLIK